jgi:hypothetical protein
MNHSCSSRHPKARTSPPENPLPRLLAIHNPPSYPKPQHYLPNFNECWWDSFILDIAICNFIGALDSLLCCVAACASSG